MISKLLRFISNETLLLNEQVLSELPGSFINLQDGFVHYELSGVRNSHTVVLIHGFSTPYFIWDQTIQPLIKSGFQVLRYDLYGRGYSDRPDVKYSLNLFEKQLLNLLEKLEIEQPVDLVGLSMGADIAVHFTNRHSNLIRKVCLIDPACFFSKKTFIGQIFNMPILGELLMFFLGDLLLISSLYDDFYNPQDFPDYKDSFIQQMQYKGFKKAILSTYRSFSAENFIKIYTQLGTQEQPVLLLWGAEDRTVPLEMSEKVLESIPQIQFHVISETRHIPHYEKPNSVNSILIEFLNN